MGQQIFHVPHMCSGGDGKEQCIARVHFITIRPLKGYCKRHANLLFGETPR